MNTKLFPAAAFTAALLALPHAACAAVIYTDNAGNYSSANPTNYVGLGGDTPGFGAFNVTATGSAGTFLYSASPSEGDRGTPAPSTIDTPTTPTSGQPQSFGLFANNNNNSSNSSVTITRAFSTPETAGLDTAGDAFSLDLVTGYNDGGSVGVELTNFGGATGSFIYDGSTGNYDFNGTAIGPTFRPGALHLAYTLTSPTDYTLVASLPADTPDSVPAYTFTGTGTFSSPITGFEVQQTKAGTDTGGDHNAYFNNLDLAAAPEPSEAGVLMMMGLGLGGLLLRRRAGAR